MYISPNFYLLLGVLSSSFWGSYQVCKKPRIFQKTLPTHVLLKKNPGFFVKNPVKWVLFGTGGRVVSTSDWDTDCREFESWVWQILCRVRVLDLRHMLSQDDVSSHKLGGGLPPHIALGYRILMSVRYIPRGIQVWYHLFEAEIQTTPPNLNPRV